MTIYRTVHCIIQAMLLAAGLCVVLGIYWVGFDTAPIYTTITLTPRSTAVVPGSIVQLDYEGEKRRNILALDRQRLWVCSDGYERLFTQTGRILTRIPVQRTPTTWQVPVPKDLPVGETCFYQAQLLYQVNPMIKRWETLPQAEFTVVADNGDG